jgi:hypothetical protein
VSFREREGLQNPAIGCHVETAPSVQSSFHPSVLTHTSGFSIFILPETFGFIFVFPCVEVHGSDIQNLRHRSLLPQLL